MSQPILLTVNKRRRCDAPSKSSPNGCGYDKSLTKASPKPKMTHQEQEALFAELKFPGAGPVKGHKHHFVNDSWVEITGLAK